MSPDWIEATGTWFGAVATVLTLLWAVQTFRADQFERGRQEMTDARLKEEALHASDKVAQNQAAQIGLTFSGGAGYGNVGQQTMPSLHLNFYNETEHVAVIEQVELDHPVVLAATLRMPIRVDGHKTHVETVDIAHIPADAKELSGQPVTRFLGKMIYRIDGRTWQRSTDGERPALRTGESS